MMAGGGGGTGGDGGGDGGGGTSPSSVGFLFFKVMIGPFRRCLYIPPLAARKLEILRDHMVYLEDSNGNRWHVQVSIVEQVLAFNRGWEKFVVDHEIIPGEFIVFKYNGGKMFSVHILGLSGCERLYFPVKKNEDMLKLNSSTFSNHPPPIKGAKTSIKSQTKPLLDEEQLLHAKDSLGCKIAKRHTSRRPSARKNKGSAQTVGTFHGTDAQKRRKIDDAPKEQSEISIDSGVYNSFGDGLDNQNAASTNGVNFLINEDGICFSVTGEHVINEENQKFPTPIDVDVSDMVNIDDITPFATNEAVTCDHEPSIIPKSLPTSNFSGNSDVSIEHPRNFGGRDLGHAPSTLLEVPSDGKGNLESDLAKPLEIVVARDFSQNKNPLSCSSHLPERPGRSLDLVIRKELPSVENPLLQNPCTKSLPEYLGSLKQMGEKSLVKGEVVPSDEIPIQCLDNVLEGPKPVGVEVLALPEPIRFSFTISAEIKPNQEFSWLLPIKNLRIERKVVLLRDSSRRVWPILYHQNRMGKFTGFSSGWKSFTSANGVKGGELCVLELASEHDALFDVHLPK